MILPTFVPSAPIGLEGRIKTGGVPFGARGSMSVGSGLRSGVTLLEGVDRAAAELNEVRQALAEAKREAARGEARRLFSDAVQARISGDETLPTIEVKAADGANGSDAVHSVLAAHVGSAPSQAADRGSVVNVAV